MLTYSTILSIQTRAHIHKNHSLLFFLHFLFSAVPPIVDTFSTLNSTKLIAGNVSFTVTLKYAPKPLPTTTWLHNGLPVDTSGSRATLSSNSLAMSLTNLAVSDRGMYTVLIRNSIGSEKVIFLVDVQGKF